MPWGTVMLGIGMGRVVGVVLGAVCIGNEVAVVEGLVLGMVVSLRFLQPVMRAATRTSIIAVIWKSFMISSCFSWDTWIVLRFFLKIVPETLSIFYNLPRRSQFMK